MSNIYRKPQWKVDNLGGFTMAKIQKACEKSGLSIGPDMIIG